jgi:hypothetical protein
MSIPIAMPSGRPVPPESDTPPSIAAVARQHDDI